MPKGCFSRKRWRRRLAADLRPTKMCALPLPRWPALNTSLIFSDESQNKKIFVFGALYFPLKSSRDHKSDIARLERKLIDLKADYGLQGRVVKWEKTPEPGRNLEGYKALVRYLASLKPFIKSVKQTPLKTPEPH